MPVRVVIDSRRHATRPCVMAGGGRPPTTLPRATKESRGWPAFAGHDTEGACYVVRTSVVSRLGIASPARAGEVDRALAPRVRVIGPPAAPIAPPRDASGRACGSRREIMRADRHQRGCNRQCQIDLVTAAHSGDQAYRFGCATTLTCPCPRECGVAGFTTITTSWPSKVRKWMSRSVEKPDS
jgi:hypothetical protein